MLQGRLLPTLAAFAIALSAVGLAKTAKADGSPTEIAAISGVAGKLARQTALPAPLSDSDLALYRQAFDHQKQGQWPAADRDLAHLENPLLIGHVLAERYLSPGYHSTGEELTGWMARFADLPQAEEIYTLTKSRLGPHVLGLKPPARHTAANGSDTQDEQTQWDDGMAEPSHSLSAADRRRWQVQRDRVHWMIHHDRADQALSMIADGEAQHLFNSSDADRLKAALAMSYFVNGRIAEARDAASQAADRSGVPEANWVAGLAAWRNGDHAGSAHYFEAVANASGLSNWTVAAGSYWAARANLAARRPQVVNHWLRQAAAYPRTFYGLLARRALGQDIDYAWESHPFTEADAEILRQVPAAQRALALMQLGNKGLAEDDLSQILPSAGPALSRSLLALAGDGGLPSLAVQAGSLVAERDGKLTDSADYPLPNWKPTSGWTIDRALLLAIARQESSFNPRARNPSGALGLMQLMPATARVMGSTGHLTDPQVNLELGQRYVRRLLDADGVKGNLLCLAAAYNVGPATVAHWLQTIKPGDDALLFLESIPFHETRSLVEHVMTNFWAYRNRFNQSSPSLDAIAAGHWPMYDGASTSARIAFHAQN